MNTFRRFCVRAFLIVSCVFSASNLNAGVSADTIVQTQDGPKSLRILKIGDKILCTNLAAAEFNIEEGVINSIEEVEANEVVEITTSDNVTFYVAADQKLFVTHKWVEARQLTLEDVLLTTNRTFVKIMSIRHLQKPMTLRFITVDKHPTFWAAENGVLVYNGPICGALTYIGIKVGATVGICAGTTVAVAAAAGTLPVTGPLVAVGGSVATAGISIVAPLGTATTLIGAGAMGTATTAGTVLASGLQGAAALTAAAAAVESAAVTASLWVGCCPFLP